MNYKDGNDILSRVNKADLNFMTMQELEINQLSNVEDATRVKSAVSWLRRFSPGKMHKIDVIREERKQLLNLLVRDEEEHFLGANRFHRIMDCRGTEGKIVRIVEEGFLQGNEITSGRWGEVLVGVVKSVNVGRRTQVYAELCHAAEEMRAGRRKKAVGEVLRKFEQFDPEVKKRAADEDFFRNKVLETQSFALEDTLSRLFS